MKKFKAAVIGIGFIGVAHIEALRRLGNVEVIAISDQVDLENKALKYAVPNYYTDYKKMIDELSLDFIHVCTPNNTHFEIAKYAIERKINVVLEKPMTVSVDEARTLVKLAQENHVVAAINFHNRLYPACTYIKKEIEKGTYGDIFSMQGVYVQDWLFYETDYSWRLVSKTSGKTRAVADIGSHWLDLMEYMTGHKIVELLAEFKTVYETRKKPIKPIQTFSKATSDMTYEDVPIDTEDIATITFRTDKGALGNVYISQMVAGKKNRINFLLSGTKHSVEWRLADLEKVIVGSRDEGELYIPKDAQMMASVKDQIDYPSGHTEGFPDAFKQAFKQIYHAASDPNYNLLAAQFQDGLRMMELDEKIYESAKARKWVKINE